MYLGTECHYSHQTLLPLHEAQYIKPYSQTTKPQVFSEQHMPFRSLCTLQMQYPLFSTALSKFILTNDETVPSTMYSHIRQARHLVFTLCRKATNKETKQ
jgi:hypothetical protein